MPTCEELAELREYIDKVIILFNTEDTYRNTVLTEEYLTKAQELLVQLQCRVFQDTFCKVPPLPLRAVVSKRRPICLTAIARWQEMGRDNHDT